jgi:hypothetical protein
MRQAARNREITLGSLFSLLAASIGVSASLLIALIVLISVLRGEGKRYVNRTRYIIDTFSIHSEAVDDQPFIQVTGRHQGLIAWIMTLLGIDTKFGLTVTGKEWRLRAASLAGMTTTMVPLGHVEEVIGGYQRSLLALFLTIFLGIQAIWIAVRSLIVFLSLTSTVSESIREATAKQLSSLLIHLLIWVVCFAIVGTIYYLSKRMMLAVKTTYSSGIVLKSGLIDSRAIEPEEIEKATWLLNELVKAAYYGEAGKGIPSVPPDLGATRPQSLLLPWQAASAFFALLVLLGISAGLFDQYGSGVTLAIHTSPAKAAIFLDNQYLGASDGSGNFNLHTTREKHTLLVEAQGYKPLSPSVKPGTFESAHTVDVSLPLLSFPITITTNPPDSNVLLDGKPIGTSDDSGKLSIPDVSYGEHYIAITHEGYQTSAGNIRVREKHSWTVNLVSLAQAKAQQQAALQQQAQSALAQARSLFQQGNYQGALNECNTALQIDPGNAAALALKARIEQTQRILGK